MVDVSSALISILPWLVSGCCRVGQGLGLDDVDRVGTGAGQRDGAEEPRPLARAGSERGRGDGRGVGGVEVDAVGAGRLDVSGVLDVGRDLVGDLVLGHAHADGDRARDAPMVAGQGGRAGGRRDRGVVVGQERDAVGA